MLWQAFFPELDQPVPLDKLIVFLCILFPNNWPVIKDVFLSLFECPFCSLDNFLRFSPARFTRPVPIELVRLIGDSFYLIHDWLEPFVGCEKVGVLDHLNQTVVVSFQNPLLVSLFEHHANVVYVTLKKDTCILLEWAWLRIFVSSVYGQIIFTADENVLDSTALLFPVLDLLYERIFLCVKVIQLNS